MSTVLRFKTRIRMMIYTGEAKSERPHVHVKGAGGEAKVWLDTFGVARTKGYSEKALTEIVEHIEENAEQLLDKWEEYHGEDEETET